MEIQFIESLGFQMLLQNLDTGLISQEILVLSLHHPGVARVPELENKWMEDKVIIRPYELLQNGVILFFQSSFEHVVESVYCSEGSTPPNATTAMHHQRTISMVLLMNRFDKVNKLGNVLYHFVVGPEFEMHVLHNLLFTLNKITLNYLNQTVKLRVISQSLLNLMRRPLYLIGPADHPQETFFEFYLLIKVRSNLQPFLIRA